MVKNGFIILKFKKLIFPFIICLFILLLLLFSKSAIIAAKGGLLLWVNSVVPSLLPFFIATNLLSHTPIVYYLGKYCKKLMKPLFNVPGEGIFPLIMGIISGYPVGAKIISDFKAQKICTDIECERLLAFTNNSGPFFIIGTVGISLFMNTSIGFLLFFVHLLSCLSVGIIFRFWKYKNNKFYRLENSYEFSEQYLAVSNLGEMLSSSIINSIKLIVMIGGFVVLFSVIISILIESRILSFFVYFAKIFNISEEYTISSLIGLLELTNGIQAVASIITKSLSTNIVLCSFLLGFGGFSVLLQILSITSQAHISIKPYIIGKIAQACFSAIYMVLILKFIPFFNLNL